MGANTAGLPGLLCAVSPESAYIYQSLLPWGPSGDNGRGVGVRVLGTWRRKASEQPGLLGVLVNVSQGAPLAQGTQNGLQDPLHPGAPCPPSMCPLPPLHAPPAPPPPQASDSTGLLGASWQG